MSSNAVFVAWWSRKDLRGGIDIRPNAAVWSIDDDPVEIDRAHQFLSREGLTGIVRVADYNRTTLQSIQNELWELWEWQYV